MFTVALLATAGAATLAGYLIGRQRAVRKLSSTPAPRAALDKLHLPSSPAVLGRTPERRLYDGPDLQRARTIEDLRAMAHRRLPSLALEYLEGGAEEEATLVRNLEALSSLYLVHDSLIDVADREISTSLFERQLKLPVVIAPTGLNGLFWPKAEIELAWAAAAAGIPYVQSTMSNDSMEEVARRVPHARRWWQLYVFGPPAVAAQLIKRALDVGCEALVVTVDADIYGNREWDRRNWARRPEMPNAGSVLDAIAHPRWLSSTILSRGMPRFENVLEYLPPDKRGFFDSAFWIRSQMDQRLSWDTIKRFRDIWPRRLVIKGLLSAADVARAAEIGADAVVLSNHGGRQLDWAVSGLDVLPEARAVVGRKMAILVDGGIRRGTDIIKAVALGADAVLLGRATLYGLAAGGRAGVLRALDILEEELRRDLGLMCVRAVGDLGLKHLRQRPQSRLASCGSWAHS